MKLFLDTANVDEIRKANEMGVICGVTTNPSLIAKEGRDYAETLKEICGIVDGPISGEVKATTEDAVGMIKEGREIFAIDPKHMVVKIPMTLEGLKAIKIPVSYTHLPRQQRRKRGHYLRHRLHRRPEVRHLRDGTLFYDGFHGLCCGRKGDPSLRVCHPQ